MCFTAQAAYAGTGALSAIGILAGGIGEGQGMIVENSGGIDATAENKGDATGEKSKIRVAAGLGVQQTPGFDDVLGLQLMYVDNTGNVNAKATNYGQANSGAEIDVAAGAGVQQ